MPTLVVIEDALRLVDPREPVVRFADLGFTRGDGVFESVGVHRGTLMDVEPHLDRLEYSARMLDLPAPDRAAFAAAIDMAVSALFEQLGHVPDTALCKLIYTRGDEPFGGAGTPGPAFGLAFADVYPDVSEKRRRGVAALTLTRGYPLNIGAEAPWLLVGAKSLSYAFNMAAMRYARAQGAEDVILTTTDGYVLECPQSNVIALVDGVAVTPAIEGGLLHGTAQRAAFAYLGARGIACDYRPLTLAELESASSIWLTNSVQMLRPVRALNGVERSFDAELNAQMLEHLLSREG